MKYWLLIIACLLNVQLTWASDSEIARIYDKQCATCHGNAGDGKGRAGASLAPAPTDFTSAQSKRSLTQATLELAIKNGKPGTAMVGYGRRFNETQIQQLAEYIRREFMNDESLQTVTLSGAPGKKIYADNCSACHGDNGNSAFWAKTGLNPPPRNFTSEEAKKELSRDRMIASVTHGRPGTAMMSFRTRLSSDEIESVVDYIRNSFMFPDTHTIQQHEAPDPQTVVNNLNSHAQLDMDAAFPDGLSGNLQAGENFYQANCYACHGKKGLGDGPRAHFNTPSPRNFNTQASRAVFNRPRLFSAIAKGKRGTVMPAWSTVLNDQQIADVAEYVFQAFIKGKKKL